jgi:hypothetical protein
MLRVLSAQNCQISWLRHVAVELVTQRVLLAWTNVIGMNTQ